MGIVIDDNVWMRTVELTRRRRIIIILVTGKRKRKSPKKINDAHSGGETETDSPSIPAPPHPWPHTQVLKTEGCTCGGGEENGGGENGGGGGAGYGSDRLVDGAEMARHDADDNHVNDDDKEEDEEEEGEINIVMDDDTRGGNCGEEILIGKY